MIRRLATPIALVAAIVVYLIFFTLLGGAGVLVRVLVPAALAAGASFGVFVMTGRTKAQLQADNYQDEAQLKVREVHRTLQQIKQEAKSIRNPKVRAAIDHASVTVRELLARIEQTQPSSLYSSAARLGGHVHSLLGVVDRYADIEARPQYYNDSAGLLAQGHRAIVRFDEFALESIRLVNQGDMAEYQANLDTVAPPEIPQLGD